MAHCAGLPLPPGLSLRFADSELAGLRPWSPPGGGPGLELHWAAAAVAAPGQGLAGGLLQGHVRGLRLQLWPADQASLQALPQGALLDGEVHWQGRRLRELLLPCRLEGALDLQLFGRHGQAWHWQGRGLCCELDGNLSFFESLAC